MSRQLISQGIVYGGVGWDCHGNIGCVNQGCRKLNVSQKWGLSRQKMGNGSSFGGVGLWSAEATMNYGIEMRGVGGSWNCQDN